MKQQLKDGALVTKYLKALVETALDDEAVEFAISAVAAHPHNVSIAQMCLHRMSVSAECQLWMPCLEAAISCLLQHSGNQEVVAVVFDTLAHLLNCQETLEEGKADAVASSDLLVHISIGIRAHQSNSRIVATGSSVVLSLLTLGAVRPDDLSAIQPTIANVLHARAPCRVLAANCFDILKLTFSKRGVRTLRGSRVHLSAVKAVCVAMSLQEPSSALFESGSQLLVLLVSGCPNQAFTQRLIALGCAPCVPGVQTTKEVCSNVPTLQFVLKVIQMMHSLDTPAGRVLAGHDFNGSDDLIDSVQKLYSLCGELAGALDAPGTKLCRWLHGR